MTDTNFNRYADTRQYDLLLLISGTGIDAFFKEIGVVRAPELGPSDHRDADPEHTLKLIEDTIYDHPMLLEEYRLSLLIHTPQVLYFPSGVPTELIEECMKRVYDADHSEFFTEQQGQEICAFYICKGLKDFLQRTFPAVEIRHHLSPLKQQFCTASSSRTRVYADYDSKMLSLLAFDGTRFLHGSTHPVSSAADAAYFVFALWQRLGLTADSGELNVSGPKEARQEFMTLLRRHLNYVMLTLLPRLDGAEKIPTSILLCSTDNSYNN